MTTFHGTSGFTGNGVSSGSASHDFGTGSNRGAGIYISHNGTITGVTVGGVACTQVGSDYTGPDTSYKVAIWALSAPATGLQTVEITFSASSTFNACVISMTDAHQTTASLTGARVNNGNLNASPTVTGTTVSGELFIAATASNQAFTPVTPGTGVSVARDNEAVFISQWCAYKSATGTSTTVDGTATGFEGWGMSGVSFVSAAVGGSVFVPKSTIVSQAVHRAAFH